MKFKEKASALALCAVLLGTSVAPVSAASQGEIIGKDRYETAAKVADKLGNYSTAILVNSDKTLADGLSASSLAGKENAPILLVQKNNIPKATMDRLRKVKKVYIIGGKAAISDNVSKELKGKQVIRIEGKDRIDTSVKVAKLIGHYDKAFLVNGFKGEADAMSVASVAAREKAPILLTNGKTSIHKDNTGVEYFAIGGDSVISSQIIGKHWAARIGGNDRYETNRLVMNRFYPNSSTVYFTKGKQLVDALTVSSLAKNNGVVLVSPNSDNSILKDKNIIQVGGMDFTVNPDGSVKPNPKPDNNKPDVKPDVKPDNNKPDVKPDEKPNPKPDEKPVNPGKNTAPTITSRNKFYVFENGASLDFSVFGVKAYDKEDGDITNKVTYHNIPDMTVPGVHKVTAKVEDKGGLTASIVIEVHVKRASTVYDVNSAEYQQEFKKEFYSAMNAERTSRNFAPLFADSGLEQWAYLKSKHMADFNYFDHLYNGQTINKMYPDVVSNAVFGGENIKRSAGNKSPQELAIEAFNAWMRSDGHKENLLNSKYEYAGIGAYKIDNRIYITLDFGY